MLTAGKIDEETYRRLAESADQGAIIRNKF
jgi:hypothetical protein